MGSYNSSHTGAEIDSMVAGKPAKYGLASGYSAPATADITGSNNFNMLGNDDASVLFGMHGNLNSVFDATLDSTKKAVLQDNGYTETQLDGAASAVSGSTKNASWSTIFGRRNMVNGTHCFAEGVNNAIANAYAAHVEGTGNLASGEAAHAEGRSNVASGAASHAGGSHTIASASDQTAVGKYNAEHESALFIVGNGTGAGARSNAFQVEPSATRINTTGYVNASTAITSDENLKNSITSLPNGYLNLFDALRPVIYKYNDGTSNRYHTGFIAQEVGSAIQSAGLTTSDFAGYVVDDDGTQYLRYEEFIALAVAKIQSLEQRIAALEGGAGES